MRSWMMVVAVTIFAMISGGGVSAQSPAHIELAQVTAQIPTAPDTPFPLRWGGGSHHHLKARLATLGCIADLIWAYDETSAQWRPYSQYRAPASLNRPFLDDFREHLPAGGLYATCFDPCDFRYFDDPFDDPPDAAIRCGAHPTGLSQLERADWSGGIPFGSQLSLSRWFFRTAADWLLPAGSPWLGIYNASPVELAAELCAEQLARRLGLDSQYAASRPGILTPEITAWLDRWLLLPELRSLASGA